MNERSIDLLQKRVYQQQEARPVWQQNNTPLTDAQLLANEANELVEAIENFDVNPDAEYEVISEVGDVLYLALKFCSEMGIDPVKAVELKLWRNDMKYAPSVQTDGRTPEAAIQQSKTLYKYLGGDHAFFMAHSETVGLEESGSRQYPEPQPQDQTQTE